MVSGPGNATGVSCQASKQGRLQCEVSAISSVTLQLPMTAVCSKEAFKSGITSDCLQRRWPNANACSAKHFEAGPGESNKADKRQTDPQLAFSISGAAVVFG
jgi:hypothetical protein